MKQPPAARRSQAQKRADAVGHKVYLQHLWGVWYIAADRRGPANINEPWFEYWPTVRTTTDSR